MRINARRPRLFWHQPKTVEFARCEPKQYLRLQEEENASTAFFLGVNGLGLAKNSDLEIEVGTPVWLVAKTHSWRVAAG